MRKLALLAAVGLAALAPSMARADTAAPQPCCQDTVHMFRILGDGLQKQSTWKPYVAPAPVAIRRRSRAAKIRSTCSGSSTTDCRTPYAAKKK